MLSANLSSIMLNVCVCVRGFVSLAASVWLEALQQDI